MKKLLKSVFFVVFAGLIAPHPLPAQAAQVKTISGFVSSETKLSLTQEAQVAQLMRTGGISDVTCVGYYLSAKKPLKSAASARAQSVCDFATKVKSDMFTGVMVVATKSAKTVNTVTLKIGMAKTFPKDPFDTAFPAVFTRSQVIQKAISNLAIYTKPAGLSSSPNIVYESTFPNSEKDWTTRLTNRVNNVLPFPADYKYLSSFGSTDQFAMSEIVKSGGVHPSAGPCNRATTYESYCASRGWAAFIYSDSINRKAPIRDSGKRSVVAHELFHVWQKTVDGSPADNNLSPDSPNGLPLWFAEGNANFVGFALTHLAGETDYLTGRLTQVDAYMNANKKSLRDHVVWVNSPYGYGQASAEYLVASVGFERVLEVYRLVGKGQTFASAFQQSIGISLDDYYSKFDSVQANFLK